MRGPMEVTATSLALGVRISTASMPSNSVFLMLTVISYPYSLARGRACFPTLQNIPAIRITAPNIRSPLARLRAVAPVRAYSKAAGADPAKAEEVILPHPVREAPARRDRASANYGKVRRTRMARG